jgi:hypothetical protein
MKVEPYELRRLRYLIRADRHPEEAGELRAKLRTMSGIAAVPRPRRSRPAGQAPAAAAAAVPRPEVLGGQAQAAAAASVPRL